jgi:hypothetical protein
MATQGTTGQTVVAGWTFSASGVNNGGTAIGIGNTGVTPLSNDLAIATIADDYGAAIGSVVVSNDGTGAATTDRVGVGKAVSGGTLAFNPNARDKRDDRSETWIIRGVTTKLSDVANTALLSRGTVGDGRYDNTHGTIADRKLGSYAIDINAVPSTNITPNTTITGGGGANTYVNPADGTAAVSTEIFPSRSVPGELTYHFGGLGKPTTDEYKAKDSNE